MTEPYESRADLLLETPFVTVVSVVGAYGEGAGTAGGMLTVRTI